MPAQLPPGLAIAAIPPREDPRDAFVSETFDTFDELPRGARLGTASLRRQAQALYRRPDLQVVMLRGNVDTRLAKLRAGEADAILLAAAGLRRLGLGELPQMLFDPAEWPPAPGQGALAIETRAEDADLPWLAALRDAPTTLAVAAERGAMLALEGSCRTAIGAYAVLEAARLRLVVEALTPDGAQRFRRHGEISGDDGEDAARQLGLKLGREIAEEGGEALLAPI